jgi:signal transduction histidine kinase
LETYDQAGSEAELAAQLGRKVAQQAAVAELGRLALTGSDVPSLYTRAVEMTRDALGTELVSILQLDEELDALTCRTNVGWDPAMIRPVPLGGRSQVAHTYLAEEPTVVPDLAEEEVFEGSKHLLAHGIVSAAAVPIRGKERAVGVLAAHSRSSRRFSPDDVLFLRGIANVLAAAVARERADDARRASEERLAYLAEASGVLGSSLDVEHTIAATAGLLVPRLAERCAIHLARDGRLARVAGDAEPPFDLDEVLRSGTGRIAAGALAVPLGSAGTISLVAADPAHRFAPEDLALVEELGRRAALAIENARAHDAEQASRGRAERLQRLTARLADAFTVEAVTEIVLDKGLVATGAPSGLVAMLQDDGETVAVVAERGYRDGTFDAWHTFPLDGQLPVSVALRTRDAVFCATGAERDALFPSMATLPAAPSHALAVLPLLLGGEALGALVLSFADDHDFPEEDRQFLQAIANQCAQALDRARLYAEREQRAEASRALEFVADGVVLVDVSGTVRLWNAAAARILGISPGEAIGAHVTHVVPRWRGLMERVPPGRPATLPLELGDRELWLSMSVVAFPEGVVCAFRDVTHEHALERMKSDFIATVSHELRTPLAAVYGAATTLRRRGELGEAEREQFLEMIEAQSQRLAQIVDEILIASRLEAGEVPIELGPVDGVAVAREVVALAQRSAPDGFRIQLDADDAVPPVVADSDRLRQVLTNLVENAVKYSGASDAAEVSVARANGAVRFAVRDRGLGIPSADHERIFEKFYRVDADMLHGVSGTGLGLYIVRELVERMNGSISVESTEGQGSEFAVELPTSAP